MCRHHLAAGEWSSEQTARGCGGASEAAGVSGAGRSPPVRGSNGGPRGGSSARAAKLPACGRQRGGGSGTGSGPVGVGGRQAAESPPCVVALRRDGSFLRSHGEATEDDDLSKDFVTVNCTSVPD
jgi:hypothetical protein